MKKNTSSYLIIDGLVLSLFFLMSIPQFKLLSVYNYLCLGVAYLLFFIIIWEKGVSKLMRNPVIFFTVAYSLLSSIIPLLLGHVQIFNRYINLSAIFVFYVIYYYNKQNRGNKVNVRLLIIFMIIQLYTVFSTLYALSENGSACRQMKSSFEPGDVTYFNLLFGVSSYDLIYSTVIEAIVLFWFFVFGSKFTRKMYRILMFFFVILFSILVVMSNYFTATILLFLGFAMTIIAKQGVKILILLVPVLCIYAMAYKTINETAFNVVLSAIPEGKTYDRIIKIQQNGESTESEDIDSREETNEKTEELIIRYPIFGYIADENFELANVGQHSYFLDTIAIFGVIIGLLGCYAMVVPFVFLFQKEKSVELKRMCLVVGGTFFLLLFRNNIALCIGFSAYFFFPTVFTYLKEQTVSSDLIMKGLPECE